MRRSEMNGPQFSVIIPVYNAEKYLNVCIDSILGQTYHSFEIILVDDGSKDASGKICDEYRTKYPGKISVLHKENGGQVSARCAGLKLAKGEYICFVDSDDYIVADTLEKVYKIIDGYQADMIVFGNKSVDVSGNVLEGKTNILFKEGIVEKECFFKKVISLELNSVCYKICKYNLFDVEQDYSQWHVVSRGEDLLQTLPAICKAQRIYYTAERFYCYRENQESVTHIYQQKDQHHELDIVLPFLYDCMVELGYDGLENIRLFYKSYLEVLWGCLCHYFWINTDLKDYRIYFEKISDIEYVKKAKIYICEADGWKLVGRRASLGLRMFYGHNWKTLKCYLELLAVAHRLKGKIKLSLKKTNAASFFSPC